jgi:hypothetical protein
MRKKAPPSAEEKEEAEKLKLEGNDLMRSENFPGAIEKYTKYLKKRSFFCFKNCCSNTRLFSGQLRLTVAIKCFIVTERLLTAS